MARTSFESLEVYRLSEQLADNVWDIVLGWKQFARDTVGTQLVRAADGVGANIAEGTGRRFRTTVASFESRVGRSTRQSTGSVERTAANS